MSTVASNTSFVGSTGGGCSPLYQRSPQSTDLKEAVWLADVRRKVAEQEARLSQVVARGKDRDRELREERGRGDRLERELEQRKAQVGELKKVVGDYERQVRSLVAKTNDSLERVLRQKNAEIDRLTATLSLFEDQYEAKLEAEVLSQTTKNSQIPACNTALTEANEKITLLTAQNQSLLSEITAYQRQLSDLKAQKTLIFDPYLTEIEVIMTENQSLKEKIALKTAAERENSEKTALIYRELCKHRCSLSFFSRILLSIHGRETVSLSELLRNREETEMGEEDSLNSCLREVREVGRTFEKVQKQAVDWYATHFGQSCRVS